MSGNLDFQLPLPAGNLPGAISDDTDIVQQNPDAQATTNLSKVDTVTKYDNIDKQNLRRTGTITVTINGQSFTISLNPSQPTLPTNFAITNTPDNLVSAGTIPDSDTTASGANATNSTSNPPSIGTVLASGTVTSGANTTNSPTSLKANPFFNISFLAVFYAIISEILKLEKNIRYVEAQSQIKGEKLNVQISTDIAGLIKSGYDAQAQQALLSAITNFVSAGINTIALVQTVGAAGRTKNTEEYIEAENDLKIKTAELSGLRKKRTALANDLTAGEDQNAQAIIEQRIAALDKKIVEKEGLVAAAKEKKLQITSQLKDRDTQLIHSLRDISNNLVQSIDGFVKRGLIEAEGAAKFAEQVLRGYEQVLRTATDNAGKQRDEAKGAFDDIIRYLDKIVDADIKAHYLGHGA